MRRLSPSSASWTGRITTGQAGPAFAAPAYAGPGRLLAGWLAIAGTFAGCAAPDRVPPPPGPVALARAQGPDAWPASPAPGGPDLGRTHALADEVRGPRDDADDLQGAAAGKPAAQTDRPAASTGPLDELQRAAAAVPAPWAEHTLDLPTALALAGASNPTIALAQEAVRAALAEQIQARVLLLPDLDAGGSVNLHDGNLLSTIGIIRDVRRGSAYTGAGAGAVGSGTVAVPGVFLTAQLANAIYLPRIAVQQVARRRFESRAVTNDILRDVAARWLALAGAEALLTALRQSERDVGEVARLTANFARTGQGRQGDAERARSELLLLHTQVERAEGEVAAAAAELSRLLDLDPAVRLHPPAGPLPILQLVNPAEPLDALLRTALVQRPELAAAAAAVLAASTRLRQEQVRPFVPTIGVGFSAGTFGGGSDLTEPRFGRFAPRTDFDALAYWTLDNLGAGNLAEQKRLRARLAEAEAERVRVLDRVRREVAEALALVAARRMELDVARRRLVVSEETYRLEIARSRNLEARPIEVLNSANLLTSSRQELVRATVEFNIAQFDLLTALGEPSLDGALAAGTAPPP